MSNSISAKPKCPCPSAHTPLLLPFIGCFACHFYAELKLLSRAANYSKSHSHIVYILLRWIQWCRFITCNLLQKQKAVKLMKGLYCWWWVVALFASIACLLCTTCICGLQLYIIVIIWNGHQADFVSDIMSQMRSLPYIHHHCMFALHTMCMNYTLLVLNTCSRKPEGGGITKIWVCKARAECKYNFSNALVHRLLAVKKSVRPSWKPESWVCNCRRDSDT